MKTKKFALNIRIDADLMDLLKKQAEAEQRSVSNLVSVALKYYLENAVKEK